MHTPVIINKFSGPSEIIISLGVSTVGSNRDRDVIFETVKNFLTVNKLLLKLLRASKPTGIDNYNQLLQYFIVKYSDDNYQETRERDDPDVKEKRDGRRPLHEVHAVLAQPVKRLEEEQQREERNKLWRKVVSEKRNNLTILGNSFLPDVFKVISGILKLTFCITSAKSTVS